mgnify:CR=1 FL=1|jgi:hypothetical protein
MGIKGQNTTIKLSYNDETSNTEILWLSEEYNPNELEYVVSCIKSNDDDDYYEVDIRTDQYQIKNLNISKPDASEEDTYEIKYDLIINFSMDEWEEVDEKFKTAAKEREVEVEYSFENSDGDELDQDELYEKQSDGLCELQIL